MQYFNRVNIPTLTKFSRLYFKFAHFSLTHVYLRIIINFGHVISPLLSYIIQLLSYLLTLQDGKISQYLGDRGPWLF